jgi:hypothetical protein
VIQQIHEAVVLCGREILCSERSQCFEGPARCFPIQQALDSRISPVTSHHFELFARETRVTGETGDEKIRLGSPRDEIRRATHVAHFRWSKVYDPNNSTSRLRTTRASMAPKQSIPSPDNHALVFAPQQLFLSRRESITKTSNLLIACHSQFQSVGQVPPKFGQDSLVSMVSPIVERSACRSLFAMSALSSTSSNHGLVLTLLRLNFLIKQFKPLPCTPCTEPSRRRQQNAELGRS